jgi:predicted 2-oxoglutarate/Fe(II)-dependent dioxygenase YbiX
MARLAVAVVVCCYHVLCPAAVTSFIQQRHKTTNIHASHLYTTTIIATPQPHDENGTIISSSNIVPDEDIVAMNIKMHQDAVKKSENTFYGFYPDGFTEFNVDMSPSNWTSYSVDKVLSTTNPVAPTATNIWDTFLQLDKRIVPPPFQSTDLAKTSQTPIITRDECSNIISECENHFYGWGSSNERYGTPSNRVGYMLPLENLSFTYTFINFELLPRLFPAISLAFSESLTINPENLRLGGCRVVKYDAADGHVELGMHRDGLLVTANIALNDLDEYEGGGTIVEGLKEPIRLPIGNALLHPGDVKHGGNAITSGVRYALVCFIFDTTIVPHEKYCQDRMKADVDAAMAIPIDDAARLEERVRLLNSATKHCADAYKFGKLSCGDGGSCDDGYEEIVRSFGSRYQTTI